MNRQSGLLAAATNVLLLAVAGCGESTVVSGNVTYEGKPVENGSITFLPADGLGPSSGGTIAAGRYRIDDLPPGQKIVEIVGLKTVPFARTTAELAQQAEEAKQPGRLATPVVQATAIPADAQGNHATVEVKAGKQTLDFHLKRPPET